MILYAIKFIIFEITIPHTKKRER